MRRAVAALAVPLAIAAVALAPTPVSAAPGSSSITVFLKAPDPQALADLAANTRSTMSRADRLAALQSLVPSAGTRAHVASVLQAEGFRITGQTTWSVTATASPTTTTARFGPRSSVATRPLPFVPSSLGPDVAGVFPTTGGPAVYHAHDLQGRDWRNAYAPANVTPSTGLGAGVTIATVQFSNFSSGSDAKAADLTGYANKQHVADPVAAGRWHAITVDGGPTDANGADEVDIDTQSILSVAPNANQTSYFAPNTTAGFTDAFAQVYDDVAGTGDAQRPDPHIVALSSSWGDCEANTGAAAIATLEPILQALTAAGVTVFSASGDNGIYDCGDPRSPADVDYPASSPSVIGVGGTNLLAPTPSAPNTGTNWRELSWTCHGYDRETDFNDCTDAGGSGGSGGGASGSAYPHEGSDRFSGFPAPVYQRMGIDNAPYAGNAKRLVPDIAAAADPYSGFAIFTDGQLNPGYGGTSLAAPICAAQLATALAETGRTTGVGDIHGALYSAYRQTRSLAVTNPNRPVRDINAGFNGAVADKATDPSVQAHTGYDTVTGVGSVLWKALLPYLFDKRTPTASVTFTEAPITSSSWRNITARWTVKQGSDSSLLNSTFVRITRLGDPTPVYAGYTLPASSSRTITAVPGSTYLVQVVGRDLSGRTAPPVSATVRVPLDDAYMPHRAGDGWVRQYHRADVAGSNIYTTRKGASATATRTGSIYSIRTPVGPTSGTLGVYLQGRLIMKINLYAPRYGYRGTRIYAGPRATRTFTFTALTWKTTHLDALYITY